VLGPEHRVEPIVALKAMTMWAACQHFEERTKGSIEVGKVADIQVLETIKKGKSIYLLDPTKTSDNSLPCMESSRCSEKFAAFRANSPLAELLGPVPHVH
jgi:predicted amidohydrolase YtcJ